MPALSLGNVATRMGLSNTSTIRLSDLYSYNANVPGTGPVSVGNVASQTFDFLHYNRRRGMFTTSLLCGVTNANNNNQLNQDVNQDSYCHRPVCVLPDSSYMLAAAGGPYIAAGVPLDFAYFTRDGTRPIASMPSFQGYGFANAANLVVNAQQFLFNGLAGDGTTSWFLQLQPPGNVAPVARTCRLCDTARCGNSTCVAAGTCSAQQIFQLYSGNAAVSTPDLLANSAYTQTGLVLGVRSDGNVAWVTRMNADRIRLATRPGGNLAVAYSSASASANVIRSGLDAPAATTAPFVGNSSVTQTFVFSQSADGAPSATGATLKPSGAGQFCHLHCLRATPDDGVVVGCNTNASSLRVSHTDGTSSVLALTPPCALVVKLDASLKVSWARSFSGKNANGVQQACRYSTLEVTPSGNVISAFTPTGYANLTQTDLLANASSTFETPGYQSGVYLTRLLGSNGAVVHNAMLGSQTFPTADQGTCLAAIDGEEGFAMAWWTNYGATAVTTTTFTFTHSDGTVLATPFYSSAFQTFQNPRYWHSFLTKFDAQCKPVWDTCLVKNDGGTFNGALPTFVVYDPAQAKYWFGNVHGSYFNTGVYVYNASWSTNKMMLYNEGTRYGKFNIVMGRVTAAGKASYP